MSVSLAKSRSPLCTNCSKSCRNSAEGSIFLGVQNLEVMIALHQWLRFGAMGLGLGV